MRKHTRSMLTFGLLAALTFGLLGPVAPAFAGVKGRRTTAELLSATAIWEFAKGSVAGGVVAGAAAYYAWQRTKAAKRHRHHYTTYRSTSHRRHRR